MASLWADMQLGMWDVQAGIPGKPTSLRKECCIDRKVWIGNLTLVKLHYCLWSKVSLSRVQIKNKLFERQWS